MLQRVSLTAAAVAGALALAAWLVAGVDVTGPSPATALAAPPGDTSANQPDGGSAYSAPAPSPVPAPVAAAATTAASTSDAPEGSAALVGPGLDLSEPWRVAPKTPHTLDGFRMEGAAELPFGFGDSQTLAHHLERFYKHEARLGQLRRSVARHAATVLDALPSGRRFCPGDIAVPYYRVQRAGQRYEQLGAELEASYRVIAELEGRGEGAGLTPDLRWQLAGTEAAYDQILVDYAEMRAAVGDHLQAALRYHRCRLPTLLRQGATRAPGTSTVTAPMAASRVTFFIDNQSCQSGFDLYLESALLGHVEAAQRVAFQAESGPHKLCLIAPDGSARCGDAGTVRTVHLHEGWSMTTHCQ